MSKKEIKKLSDKKLEEEIEKKYGKNWNILDTDDNDPLIIEYAERIVQVE